MSDEIQNTPEEEVQGTLTGTPETTPPPAQDPQPETAPDDPQEAERGYLRQSDYTKKTQTLADERRAFEAEKATLQQQASKWTMFEQDPNYRDAVIGMVKGANGQPQAAPAPAAEPEPDLSGYNQDDLNIMRQIAAKEVMKAIKDQVSPVLDQGRTWIEQSQRKEASQDWSALKKEFAEAGDYENQIVAELKANPGLGSIRKAFFAVAGDTLLQKRMARLKEQDTQAKESASVPDNSVASSAVEPAKGRTLADIVAEEMDKQRA